MKSKLLRNFCKFIISSTVFTLIYTLVYTAVFGMPSAGFLLKSNDIVSVEITRIDNQNDKVETITVTPADDDMRQKNGEPFMKFQLAPNMINMLRRTWQTNHELEAEYIYKFNMSDGSINIFYIDNDEIGINNKIYKLHSEDDFATFKNITDNIYFE